MDQPKTEVHNDTEQATHSQTSRTSWYHKRSLIAAAIAIVVLAGAGYWYMNTYKDGGVVAIVNGEPIYRTELEENIQLVEESAAARGMNTEDEAFKAQVRTQTLDGMINDKLLVIAARDANTIVEETEIETVYTQLIESMGGEDSLKTRLEEIGLSDAELRENIEERILVDAYIESVSDIEAITVTEDEIEAFMEQNLPPEEEGVELPPLEELRPAIEAQIRSAKQQAIVEGIIEDLREEASIDVRI